MSLYCLLAHVGHVALTFNQLNPQIAFTKWLHENNTVEADKQETPEEEVREESSVYSWLIQLCSLHCVCVCVPHSRSGASARLFLQLTLAIILI